MNKEFSSSFGIALVMFCVFLCLKVLRRIIAISTLWAYFMGIISYRGVFQVQEKALTCLWWTSWHTRSWLIHCENPPDFLGKSLGRGVRSSMHQFSF